MTETEPRRPSTRSRLRPVPEPDRQPPHNLGSRGGGARRDPGRRAAAGRGRRRARGGRLLPARPPGHLAGHAAPGRPGPADRPGDRAGGARPRRRAGRCGRWTVPAHPGCGRAHRGQCRPLRPAGRRDGAAPTGDRPGHPLAHSDADPAVLAHLAGELADTTADGMDGRGWAPPVPFGATGGTPAFPVEVLPGWLGEYVAAVATATQTPPDLAGMLALAVLATVAAGAVEVQPRPGWREPLCLFVAVGMDAGARKSSVFTALTRPVAEFERQQAPPPSRRSPRPSPCGASPTRPPPTPRPPPARPLPTSRRSGRPRRSPGPPRPPT